MAKAMLIMDMPKCCALCELYYSQVGLPKCTATWRTIDFKNTEVRQEWCPLREVPSKHEDGHTLKVAIENNCYDDTVQDDAWCEGVDKGYNACIDEILGGGE